MAIYNEILSARFSRAIQKVFSMKGGAAAKQASGEIGGVLNYIHGLEVRLFEGWQHYGSVANLVGAAGQFAAFRIRNPGGSKVVATFTKITVFAPGTGVFVVNLAAQTADLGTIVAANPTRFDARGPQASAMVQSTQTTLVSAITPNIYEGTQGSVNTDLLFSDNQEIPMLPGDAITFGVNTAATQILTSVFWRERALEESELFA